MGKKQKSPGVTRDFTPATHRPKTLPPKAAVPHTGRLAWIKAHKKISLAGAVIFVLLLLTAIPATRYILPGIVVKKQLSFIVQDEASQARISDAVVQIDDQLFNSDQNGVVHVTGIVPRDTSITITKLFYKPFTQRIGVSLFSNKQYIFSIQSTGRPAKVTVKNRLSGRALAGVTVKTEQGSTAKTGSDGTAQLVLPSDKSEVKGTISGESIVAADVTIRAVQDDSTNLYQAIPAGKVFFLSKASGKIDVVSTNLDGSDRQTVLAGTGRENDADSILLASKDWKYLALKSHRDGDLAQLYLIDTATSKLTTVDASAAEFSLTGWSGPNFIYIANPYGVEQWQNKRQSLKSYNAATKQLVTLDDTRGEGTGYNDYGGESFVTTYILKDVILYTKTWYASYYYGSHLSGKTMVVTTVKADGSGKATLHDWPAGYNASIVASFFGPDELYFHITLDGVQNSYWLYQAGKVAQVSDISNEDFNASHPVYLESPNGTSTFWSEPRDGKNVLFVGDTKGKNGKLIADLSEFEAYGWYSDDYVLLSKNGSELYIMGRDGIKPGMVPVKISDYHKPSYSFEGYNKGYGGV